MGTIAELLGYSLTEPDGDPGSDPGQGRSASTIDEAVAGAVKESTQVRAGDARETAMMAILANTGLEPSHARAELTLRGDLDLDDLGLYVIVAAIEHDLKCSFPDAQVESWVTVGDILDAASRAHSAARPKR